MVSTSQVDALRSGSTAAFDAIYSEHCDRIYSFLLRASNQPALAEDLTQETFLRLISHADSLRDDSHITPWLFTVARNLLTSHWRWVGTTLRGLQRLAAPEVAADGAYSSAVLRETDAALAQLSRTDREVLLLVTVEGFSHTEAAGILGLGEATVRKRLSRARRRLRDQLETMPESLLRKEVLS